MLVWWNSTPLPKQLQSPPYKTDAKIMSSDIAGTDLFAESIGIYVAGEKSLIKHSIFTNDTNILRSFDLSDPAFSRCNIFISASNNIDSGLFPLPLSEREIEQYYKDPINSFVGFLYYDKSLSSNEVQEKSERAFNIITSTLYMDFIMVNSSDPYFFPFIGYYPQWNILLEEFTANIPKDGYWGAFDLTRLKSSFYTRNHHLSFSYALINSPDLFEKGVNFGNDQLDFTTGAANSPFLEGNLIEDVLDQLTNILEENEEFIDDFSLFLGVNETDSFEVFDDSTSSFGNFSLSEDSHYSIIEIQYEGYESGIQEIGQDQYQFSLFDALGYKQSSLEPSEKVYSAIVGSFLTQIDLNILCTDIIESTPESVEFSDYFIDQLALLSSFIETDFDVQALENYSFQLSWNDLGGAKKSYSNLVNEEDEFDIVNLLPLLGFSGFSFFPSGLANPIPDFNIQYELSNSDTSILLNNSLIGENATFGAYNTFDFNITARAVGNISAYGIPTAIPINLEETLPVIILLEGGNLNYADDLEDALWQIVDAEYHDQYEDLEDFFNLDEEPRIFQFDSDGDGSNDYFFPDAQNVSNLYPYNENMDEVSDILLSEYPQLLVNLGLTANEIEEIFTNEYSVWNEENWILDPDEMLTYLYENYSISNQDNYTQFDAFNFLINDSLGLPRLLFGEQYGNTLPEMALEQDDESWMILSEEYFDENRVEIQFLASNQTHIDLENNSLDRVSLLFNFSDILSNTEIELFNFTTEEFFSLDDFLTESTNISRTYSITKYNQSIDDIFQNPQEGDYTILFNLQRQESEDFNISINNIDIKLLERDINPIEVQSRLEYTSKSGLLKHTIHSNTITLSTDNMSSIVAYSTLSDYSASPGELITYHLTIKNIGSDIAKNITVQIPLPGIINTYNSFNVYNNLLQLTVDQLIPSERKKLNFSFYVPNSVLIKNHNIKYNNSQVLEKGNSTELTSYPNNLYCSSPVNYNERKPFVHAIKISLNTTQTSPSIQQIFNVSLSIHNIGLIGLSIEQLNISSQDQYGDLIRISNESLIFNNITHNQIKSVNFSLNKTDWKGYLYPAITLLTNNNSNIYQIKYSEPLILGSIKISVQKSVDKNELERGDLVLVHIQIKNIGTITAKNIKLDDLLSYSQDVLSLTSGKLIKIIEALEPQESVSISYKIKANSQAVTVLRSAIAEYDFIYKNTVFSNILSLKIITPKTLQNLNIIIPSIIAGGIVLIYVWYVRSYKKKLMESERKEIKILSLTSRDSILSSEINLKEYLSHLKQGKGGN